MSWDDRDSDPLQDMKDLGKALENAEMKPNEITPAEAKLWEICRGYMDIKRAQEEDDNRALRREEGMNG